MSRNYRSRNTSRSRNTRGKSKKRNYNKKQKHSVVPLYLVVFVAIVFGFYKYGPDVIEINFKVSEHEEEAIRDIVRQEFNKLQLEHTKEELNIVDNPAVQEQPQPEPVQEQPTEVTSRSLTEPRDSIEVQEVSSTVIDGYRVTSYYPGDGYQSNSTTGSGKTTNNFSTITINGKRVYTYNGKIVVATATKELLKSGYSKKGSQNQQDKHYFSYGDTFTMNIYGTDYECIVLDSCGASMWEGYERIDIFVPSSSDVINLYNQSITLK